MTDTIQFNSDVRPRVALVWRGDAEGRAAATAETSRQLRVFEALAAAGIAAEPAVYSEEAADAVRAQLMAVDGVLVWVDPISGGRTREGLDALLREVAASGVWVSAHPDVILKMGVKEVLYRTRGLGWGTDTHLYESAEAFRAAFPPRLATGPRVLKQNRGNGGIGVWKVELADAAGGRSGPWPQARVRVLEARGGSEEEAMTLGEFMRRSEAYFAGAGRMVDQPFQPRLGEGMIRCYMSRDRVVGYGCQIIRGLMPAEAGPPGPRIMSGAGNPDLQRLRAGLERDWIPGLQRLLGIATAELPVIWDADFLLGPRTVAGEDSYVLCEINVSSVFPIPDEAPAEIARTVAQAMAASAAA